jgi:hypothetical protein
VDIWRKKFKRAPECAHRVIEGEAFIVSSKNGGVHLLNEVGTFVWSLLDGTNTLDEIAAAVVDEFEVNLATARADIEDFVQNMWKSEIISESGF